MIYSSSLGLHEGHAGVSDGMDVLLVDVGVAHVVKLVKNRADNGARGSTEVAGLGAVVLRTTVDALQHPNTSLLVQSEVAEDGGSAEVVPVREVRTHVTAAASLDVVSEGGNLELALDLELARDLGDEGIGWHRLNVDHIKDLTV